MRNDVECLVADCSAAAIALGLCGTDYARYRRGKLPGVTPKRKNRSYTYHERAAATGSCTGPECDRPARAEDLCDTHAEQRRRGGALTPIRTSRKVRGCKVDGCDRPHEAHGFCATDYSRAVGRGEVATRDGGTRAPTRTKDGYVRVFIPGHPNAQSSGYVLQHIAVMAAVMDRPLLPDETVHHRNGAKADNRPENLELWTSRHPKGQRVQDVVEWAKEMLGRYDPAALA